MKADAAQAARAPELKILIVEDEFFLALEMEMCLLDAGHQVVGHGVSLRTALESADADRPDLALVDLRLAEGSSGLHVAAGLKERGVACLFVSATCAEDTGRGLALGCLHKPVTEDDLLQAIDVAHACLHGAPAIGAPRNMHLYPAPQAPAPGR